jgi:hypothetical protein
VRLKLLAARRLRVLYGAVNPLPKPPGRYHVEPTDDEQMREFEAARRRSPGFDLRRWAGIKAEQAIFNRGK